VRLEISSVGPSCEGEPLIQRNLVGLAGIAVILGSFFGTLFLLGPADCNADCKNPSDPQGRDSIRAAQAATIKAALEKYRSAHGMYPAPFNGNYVSGLSSQLVKSGFMPEIPKDPLWTQPEMQYEYASDDGLSYALYFHIELPSGKIPAGGACVTGVDAFKVAGRAFGDLPECPF
jgi:hypothetical protein